MARRHAELTFVAPEVGRQLHVCEDRETPTLLPSRGHATWPRRQRSASWPERDAARGDTYRRGDNSLMRCDSKHARDTRVMPTKSYLVS